MKIIYLLFVFLLPNLTFAQWTASGNNIYNTNTGSIGIGLNPSFGKLQIQSGNNNNFALRLEQGGFSMNGSSIFQIDAAGIYGGRFTVNTNGYVGIGTASPTAKLHVTNGMIMASDPNFYSINAKLDATSIPVLRFTRWTGTASVNHNAFVGQFYNSQLGEYSLGLGTGLSSTGDQNITSTAITLTLGGNVGIGTSSPLVKMHILGSNAHSGIIARIENTDNNFDSFAPIQFKTGASPSLWQTFARNGDFFLGVANVADYMVIKNGGNVGIGTASPGSYKLAVEGKIGAREVNVTNASWSDYVFNNDYKLLHLEKVQQFIEENHHLPDVPSEKEVLANGQDLGSMNSILLKKIEELTLYIIEMKKENEELKARIGNLEKR